MQIAEILTIIAIVLSPLIAVQVSAYLDRKRNNQFRRLYTFKTLMGTRASRLSPEHINALNMIDVEFYGKDEKSRKVVDAWKVYLDHLEDKSLLEGSFPSWSSKTNDLFIDLMAEMANCLDYEFDKVAIKKTAYSPEAHGQLENDLSNIRRGVSALFSGTASIPIKIISGDTEEKQHKFRIMIENFLQAKNPITVKILKNDDSPGEIGNEL